MSASAPSDLPLLILASGSPRRRELLARLGLRFVVRPVDVDETPRPEESPLSYVRRLAETKAIDRAESGELVLGADTVVVLEERLLGKPTDRDDARRMLRDLSGRDHLVYTGVAAWEPASERLECDVAATQVHFADLSEEEIDWYVATGEPLDKAGAYAIQGLGSLLVESITGNHSNVVGLPVPLVYRLVKRLGYDLKVWRFEDLEV